MSMTLFRSSMMLVAAATCAVSSWAADPAPPTSAGELAGKLSALRQDGTSYVRLRMEIKGAAKETLQLQIKQRLTKGGSDVLYQVLFPKERKGESVLLRRSGGRPASGSVFIPPNTVRAIDDLKEPLFGSDLSYEDVIENFYAWDQQTLAGNEAVDGVACQILESKPGKGERSSYSSVRSWIDVKRLVPLRIEKYGSGGKLLRRIDTSRVVVDGGRALPANLEVRGPRADSTTSLDGSKIKRDVAFPETQFSAEGLKEMTGAPGSQE